jgi:predicted Zn-dependent peptidase
MESERMMHPIINQIGVDTQNEVVKEEKRLRVDNQPYGSLIAEVKKNMYVKHPYRWATIGSMAHLDASTLQEFQAFNKKFYIPNNAVLVVAGDLNDIPKTKEWVQKYFGAISKGSDITVEKFVEDPITATINASYQDPNIQKPMIVASYRTPSMKTRDARVLDMISTVLSEGKSSRLYKKIVDDKKMALQIGAFSYSQEDYGMYILYGMPQGTNTSEGIVKEIDEEIVKLQMELLTDKEMQKLKNIYDNNYVNGNSNVEGIAENLASFYLLYGDVNLINTEIEMYRSITAQEIRDVAKKYLNPNQRLILDYVPSKDKAQN